MSFSHGGGGGVTHPVLDGGGVPYPVMMDI